jgi:alanyl-tRNA synthetase
MTIRLYYEDAYQTEFDAKVVRTLTGPAGTLGVVLERTCFYPTGGGQPCDLGSLDGLEVVQVDETEGEIVHWVRGSVAGPTVHGQVLWSRRFDHMQQHTGQHILSACFEDVVGAATVGFHLGEDSSTVDLDRSVLEPDQVQAVEDMANRAVYADHAVVARIFDINEIAALHLRKAPRVDHDIRIVEVSGVDQIPCGGTHCARTGEIGSIAVRHWEHRGQESRVEFLCGWRALHDHRWKTVAINQWAQRFSVGVQELPTTINRLVTEAADCRRQVVRLQENLVGWEAQQLVATAPRWHDSALIVQAYPNRDPQEVRQLTQRLSEGTATIALLGAGTAQARLFFARTADLSLDMAAVLKATCAVVGGSGGGPRHFAQGGGFAANRLAEALETARALIAKS